jgi:tricorn protease
VVPVPVPAANYGNLRTAKDALVWLRHPLTGRLGDGTETTGEIVLERYDLKKRAKSELGKEFKAFEVSGDGTRLVVNGKNGLQTRPATEGDDVVGIDLDRIAVQLDPVAEWRQGYHEAGRLMRDHYWREDMNGVDWQGVLDRYAPLVERIGTHSELIDLLWEVQGELGTSHAYAIAGGTSTRVAARACSAPTSPATPTACGASNASCRASHPTTTPARRCSPPASPYAKATPSPP